ncbi:50S ribosomal protein L6 [Candidatus Woesearchaeota archaeon CG10_big_fil_rev_8_21_14_0_10_32_9]|nr:MAG: 50S ribosomal protein L6 [Candidatus Woesearchaeota archaeon CG10_big_fil_rev_8_21_14_0_10_32_9]
MTQNKLSETIILPKGCEFKQDKTQITVKGPKGEITRKLPDLDLKIKVGAEELTLEYEKSSRREKNKLFTTKAHIKNMVQGVTEGFTYTLKVCSGHFPMTVSIKNDSFEIKNFLGEKVPRTFKIKKGADVKLAGDVITVYSHDKDLAGQTAGTIEKLTRRPGFDKRIFQDGIYITDKNGKKM